ncbi:MAG: ABC transporter permease [Anaerolineales bacterium]|nr:ABC transporter permease [Anaerolineales bacterium]
MQMQLDDTVLPRKKILTKIGTTLRQNVLFTCGLVIVLLLIVMSLGAQWISPNSPYEQFIQMRNMPPGTDPMFPLGTDQLGRCLLSRVIFGGRVSLFVGLLTASISAIMGVFLGLIGGYGSRIMSSVIERLIDIALATPEILIALGLAAVLGRSLMIVMVSVSLVWWANYARVVRGQVLRLRELDFIEAARSIGASHARILWRHIFPNAVAEVLVMITLNLSAAVLIEAGLSFLGLGTQPPTPSWGAMLSIGRNYLQTMPWLSVSPGIAIMFTVLGFNLLGDGLRDILDPRMKI